MTVDDALGADAGADAGRPGRLRRLQTSELGPDEVEAIQAILAAAFGSDEDDRFTAEDWEHAIGGVHYVLDVDGRIVAHASVVERELHVAGQPLRTGYVEAVATAPADQGTGLGTRVMDAVTEDIRDQFELGALGTGRHSFYERLGWRTWAGPAFVRDADGPRRTPDDEGFIMVLETRTTPILDATAAISCDSRPGDDW